MGLPTISAASLEYVRVQVAATAAGATHNPSTSTVAMAFIRGGGTPSSGDLKTASWDTDTTTVPPTYRAQCLVGPGGAVELAAGTYRVWIKITDSPEVPLKPSGYIKVI